MFVRMLLCLATPAALKLVLRIIALCPVLMLILPFIIIRDMKQVYSVLSWDINNVLSSILGAFLIYYFVLGCIQFRKIMDFRIKRLLLAVLTLYIVFFPFLFYENVIMRININIYYRSFFWNSFTALFNFMWNALAVIIYFRYKPFAPIGNNPAKRVSIPDISERENEIAEMLLQGMSYSSIAGKLFISNETVKTHVRNIYRKLNINSKLGLLRFSRGNG
jgi:DNA-binding CsgD family transcriptional regulator